VIPRSALIMRAMARTYAQRGFPVLPVRSGGKEPEGALARHGLHDATADRDRINKWFERRPEINVGLRTGVKFDVLDVDGEAGWNALSDLIREHGPLPSSPVVLTPTGGGHYYFRPTGFGNRAGFRRGLDWRGSGGYVVAPPSTHPNGGQYLWLVHLRDVEIEPAPPWLIERLRAPKATPTTTTAPFGGSRYGVRALEGECGRVALAPVGQRNDALVRAAYRVGQLVAGAELDLDEAHDALLLAALRAGLPETEARKTIESGVGAGLSNPRRVAS
jgi:hypothetical protein